MPKWIFMQMCMQMSMQMSVHMPQLSLTAFHLTLS